RTTGTPTAGAPRSSTIVPPNARPGANAIDVARASPFVVRPRRTWRPYPGASAAKNHRPGGTPPRAAPPVPSDDAVVSGFGGTRVGRKSPASLSVDESSRGPRNNSTRAPTTGLPSSDVTATWTAPAGGVGGRAAGIRVRGFGASDATEARSWD